MQLAKQLAVDDPEKARLVQLNFKERRQVVSSESKSKEVKARHAAEPKIGIAPQLGLLEQIPAVASDSVPTKDVPRAVPESHHIGTPPEASTPPPTQPCSSEPVKQALQEHTASPELVEKLQSSILPDEEVAVKQVLIEECSTQNIGSQEKADVQESCCHDTRQSERCISDWSSGSVRVLIVTRGGVPSCQEATRSARLEQWCQKCNINDVTFAAMDFETGIEQDKPDDVNERLRAVVREPLIQRTQPGDTWVLLLAGLDLPECRIETTIEASEVAEAVASRAAEGIVPVESLPAHVTIVCLADSRDSLQRLGLHEAALASLGDRTIRTVAMLLLPVGALGDESEQHQRRDVCINAMLRAADALSLSDGPCSLSCDDFFQEFSDQALGLAASGRFPPPEAVLHSWPQDDNVATSVRWPIAALPRNSLASKSGRESSWTLSPSLREPAPAWRRSEEPLPPVDTREYDVPSFPSQLPRGKSPASRYEPRSLLPRASWSSLAKAETTTEPSPARAKQEPRPPSREMPRQKDVRHRSTSRGMPTSLGGLSVMLTGGLKEAPQQQRAAKDQSNADAQQRRGSSTKRRHKPQPQDYDDSIE